jgi:hypothetical protein
MNIDVHLFERPMGRIVSLAQGQSRLEMMRQFTGGETSSARSPSPHDVNCCNAVPTKGLLSALTSGLPRSMCVQEASMNRRFSPIAKRWQRPRGRFGLRRQRLLVLTSVLVAATVALSACADDNTDRRFANETPPTVNPSLFTPTPVPAAVTITVETGPAILSPEALVISRGAPSHFYVVSGDELLAFTADGSSHKSVWKGKPGELRDVASSPSGDRAALLTKTDGRYDVVVIDSSGKAIKKFDRVKRLLVNGTPTPASGAGRDLIDWSPQGNQLLTAFSDGGIVRLPMNADPSVILEPGKAPGPIEAVWSPAGDSIAFVDRVDSKSAARLFVVGTNGKNNEPTELYPHGETTTSSVVDATWLPNASAVLFTKTSPEDELPQGGDLFEVPAKGGIVSLVASSGRAAPVAAIEDVVVAPNGRSIAYTVVVPGEAAPEFHSLWVQQLGTNSASRISTPAGEAVTDVWFVANGIAYRTVPSEPKNGEKDSVAVYIVGNDLNRRQVFATGSLAPATPEASPVASPFRATATPKR